MLAMTSQDYSISREIFQLWDCRGCGLRFTHPAPDPERIGAYYQSEDYISHSDTRKGIINRIYHIARDFMLGRKRRVVEAYSRSRRVLDIGCGTGYFLHHLQEHGFETFGVEVDEKAREFAHSRFGLDVRTPEALTEGTLPGQFGTVSMWHVLEHVHDPHTYLRRIAEVLDDQGILIIAVPNFTSFDAVHYGHVWAAYDLPRHLWHFRPETLTRLVEEHGFQLIGKHSLPLDPFYVALLSERYRRSGVTGMIRAGLVGLWSGYQSWKDTDRASSPVYIFRKC